MDRSDLNLIWVHHASSSCKIAEEDWKLCEEYSRTKVKKLSQLLAGLGEQTWKQKQHTHRQKDMRRTHTNWSDNSKHSLWLIRRKKLQIVVSLGELFLFVAYWTMIPIFPLDPDFLLVRSRFFISIEWQVWSHSFFVFFLFFFTFILFPWPWLSSLKADPSPI